MSKEIDQRIVEMTFDNSNFEKNVSKSLSTIDKLKSNLNFTGISKGIENVSSSIKKVDFNPLSKAAESVGSSFSALEVIGVTALANITNSAVNAGKNIVKALTIDPVTTGLQEYETQMNAIQTILANTQHQGTTLADVTAALDELNYYADMTIYNFTEMTRNIGTFTAAGLDLKTSTEAIKGIANLAAVSGSSSQQASTAMYQLSQALAAGVVTLQDWNSVVNAGMGGKVFQDALIRTAAALQGVSEEAFRAENVTGSFRESINAQSGTGWLTAEVLSQTLRQFTGDLTEAELAAIGFNESQIKSITKLAETANDAATKVKTFTQLWDTAKESAQSGWAQTWKILFGDFEEAKEYFTKLSDLINGFIGASAEARNSILGDALSSKWDKLIDQINAAGVSTDVFEKALTETAKENGIAVDELIEKHGSLINAFKSGDLSASVIIQTIKKLASGVGTFSKTTKDATDQLEYFNDIVTRVIRGEFGVGAERIKKLTEAGYDNVAVQTLVNKVWERNGKNWSDCSISAEELAEVISGLSEKELKNIGYTEEQAKALKELAAEAEKTGTPLNELINDLSKPSGRELLLGTLYNSIKSIIDLLTIIKTAWSNIFPPENLSESIYGLAESLNKLSSGVLDSINDNSDELRRTFEGLFAIVDILSTIFGGAFKLGLKVLNSVLSKLGLDVLDVTASIGDSIVAFRDFLLENELVNKAIDFLADGIINLVSTIKNLIDSFMELSVVQKIINSIKNNFTNFKEIGTNAIKGLQNGLSEGITSLPNLLKQIGLSILEAIKSVLGIHSPSTEMESVGTNIIEGLVNGVKSGVTYLLSTLKDIGTSILDFFKGVDLGKVIAAAVSGGILFSVIKISDTVQSVMSPITTFSNLLETLGDEVTKFRKTVSNNLKAEAIKSIATAIGILAASLFIISMIDPERLGPSIAALAGLAIGMGLLSVAIGKWGPKDTKSFIAFGVAVAAIAGSLVLVAASLKILESIEANKAEQALSMFVGIVGMLTLLVAMFGIFVKGETAKNISKLGTMMLQLSVSLLLMAAVIKIIGTMEASELAKGAIAIAYFVGIITVLSAVSSIFDKGLKNLGSTMLQLSASLILMVAAVKLISLLTVDELVKGAAVIGGFLAIITLLLLINKIGKGDAIAKVGSTLIAISAAMAIMAVTVKLLSTMEWGGLAKGVVGIAALAVIISLLIKTVKGVEKDAPKLAATLLAISLSIAILAAVAVALSLVDTEGLIKGIAAVSALSVLMAMLIAVTKNAKSATGTIVAITVAIGILVAAVVLLSTLDPEGVITATACITVLVGIFAILVKSTNNVNASLGALITMTVAIGLLAGVIYLLADLPVENVIAISASLAILLTSLSASMLILSKAGSISLQTSVALAAMTLALAGIAGVLILLEAMDCNPSMETVAALSVLLLSLTAACAALGVVGKLIGAGGVMQGALALDALILIVGALMMGIGALVTYIPSLETFLDKGIVILEKIGYGIGSFIGNIIGGIGAGVSNGLPQISENLRTFMDNLSGMDTSSLEGIKMLAEALVILSGANLLDSISSLFTGGKSGLEVLGEQLPKFGEAMAEFSSKLVNIDPTLVTLAAIAGKTLAEMASTIPSSGGLLQDFFGEKDLGLFGEQLGKFGEAIIVFSDTVEGNISEEAVKAAANAGLILVELVNNLPRSGGWLQDFLGELDLGLFSTQIVAFGDAIVAFSETVKDKVDEEAVKAAANAGLVLADLNNNLPRSGGWLQDFLGELDLGLFSTQIVAFGEAIVAFSETVKDKVNIDSVETAANAGKIISNLANNLPRQGGFLQAILGEQNIATFGEQMAGFGESVAEFSETVKGKVDIGAVTTASLAGQIMANLEKNIPRSGGFAGFIADIFAGDKGGKDFKETLDSFGESIVSFSSIVSGKVDPISVQAAGICGEIISMLYDNVPRDGGLVGTLTDLIFGGKGDNDFKSVLDAFGEGIVSFSGIVSNKIDPASVAAASTAGEILSNLYKSVPRDGGYTGVISWLLFGAKDGDSFHETLDAFGEGIVSFSDIVSGNVDTAAVASAALAGQLMTSLLDSLPDDEEGLFDKIGSFFSGSKNVESFKASLIAFGEAMVDFSNTISGKIDAKAITDAANAGLLLTGLLDSMPTDGEGLFEKIGAWFNGEKDSTAFKTSLLGLADAIVSFSTKVGGVKDNGDYLVSIEAIQNAIDAGQALMTFLDTMPVEGGLSNWFDSLFNGETVDGKSFATNLGHFATGIVNFSNIVKDNINTESVEAATSAGKMMAAMVDEMPDDFGSFLSGLFDEETASSLEDRLGKLGSAIVAFSNSVKSGIDASSVESAGNAGKVFSEFAKGVGSLDATNLNRLLNTLYDSEGSNFDTSFVSLGGAIADFSNKVTGNVKYDSVVAAADSLTYISNMAKGIGTIDSETMSGFSDALNSLGEAGINKFVETFTNADEQVKSLINSFVTKIQSVYIDNKPKVELTAQNLLQAIITVIKETEPKFLDKGKVLIQKLIDGMDSKENSLKDKINELMDAASSAAKAAASDFNTAGSNVVDGFVKGISDNIDRAASAAARMANAAYSAAMNALDAHSPSRKFILVGEYVDEGFAKGIADNASLSEEASAAMSEDSIDVVSMTVESGAKIVSSLLSGMNQELPVIPESFVNALNKALEQIRSKEIEFKNAGENIAGQFADALVIFNLETKLTKSLETAIETVDSKYSSFESAGRSLASAFASGLGSRGQNIKTEARDMTAFALEIVLDAIKSFDIRMLNEFIKFLDFVQVALNKMIDATTELVDDAVNRISEVINEGCEDLLTITPVLDLSKVKSDLGKLDSMFSRNQALAINSSMSNNNSSNTDTGTNTTTPTSSTISFTQNNYSPKALSRTDIYRQTKNQFSAFERMVK